MSKSYGNTIGIFQTAKQLKKNVMSIVTDGAAIEDVKDPDQCNLFNIFKIFAPPERIAVIRDQYLNGGAGYGYVKLELVDILWEYFREAREKREKLVADPGYLKEVLAAGAEKARVHAVKTIDLVRDRIGMKY
jgi:tryptophanyl-tRNA synthetase